MSTTALAIATLSLVTHSAVGSLSIEHQAIYCGAAGTETSQRYSEAVLSEVRRLEGNGLSGREAWDAMTAHYCRRSEAPK